MMFTDDVCRYRVLIQTGGRMDKGRSVDWKVIVILAVLITPPLLFYIIYAIVFGIYPSLKYPGVTMNVPEQSINRAVLYNSIQNSSFKTNFQLKERKANYVKTYKLVCYYSLPTTADSLQVDELDPYLCTHINVAFAKVVNNSILINESQKESLEKLVNLKNINKDLKILMSVGGSGNDVGFPEMISNHKKNFIQSVRSYVKNFKIDGVDLDWEFPNEHQKVHFTQLLEEFRKSINRNPNYPYLLTVAVAAPYTIVDSSYAVSYMNEFVDFINLMSYDYHFYTRETPFTGINSPLYASDNEKFIFSTLNVNFSAYYWNHSGMERSKIIIGLPTYGHTFRLANPNNNGMYAPALGYGELGNSGFVDFPQLCQFLASNQITPIFDIENKSPYAFKEYEWVSFDNSQSLRYKAEYIRDNRFGGAMVWCLNSDDYKGLCQSENGGGKRFPLISTIKNVFANGNQL
nr:chitinase-3-like protein 2 [Leptinotarsa decemlineata]